MIEVLAVAVVVAIAGLIVVPRVSGVRGVAVREAARQMADGLGFGRERAILGGATMRLVVDADGGRWRIGRAGSEPGTVGDDALVGALPASVRMVRVGGSATRGAAVAVDLRPDGDAVPLVVELADDGGRAASVTLPPGRARAVVDVGRTA